MRKLVLAASVFMFTSGMAFAAKAHRDAANEINPKIKEATATVKSGCGCAPAFAWDMKSFEKTPADYDVVKQVKQAVQKEFDDLSNTAKEFCSDAASKKLFCSKVKKIQIFTKASGDPETKFSGGTFSVHTSKDMQSGGYGMKSEMEKW